MDTQNFRNVGREIGYRLFAFDCFAIGRGALWKNQNWLAVMSDVMESRRENGL